MGTMDTMIDVPLFAELARKAARNEPLTAQERTAMHDFARVMETIQPAQVERLQARVFDLESGLRRILLSLLADNDHDAYDHAVYQAWLTGHYGGCYACAAAFTARALLEGTPLPVDPLLVERMAEVVTDHATEAPRHVYTALVHALRPGNLRHSDNCPHRHGKRCGCGAGPVRAFVHRRSRSSSAWRSSSPARSPHSAR